MQQTAGAVCGEYRGNGRVGDVVAEVTDGVGDAGVQTVADALFLLPSLSHGNVGLCLQEALVAQLLGEVGAGLDSQHTVE